MQQKVKLVAVTQGANELAGKTAQEVVSYVTRVSNPKNQLNFESAPKLLAYCIKHGHWSPFEHASLTIEITTTRGIAAQILRHRSFTFQEFSQRYSEACEYIPCNARRQDVKNKQNSIDDMSEDDQIWFKNAQEDVWNQSLSAYKEAIKRGIAKESARFLLPLNTSTTLYMTGTVRSWVHYIQLRCDQSTQLEHREIAEHCKKILVQELPDVCRALNWT